MEPQLQQMLEGKYELLEKLGQGGMGAVYKARHRLLDQLRVIKVMHSRLDERAEFAERFRREARVAAELSHPNIATLHDFAIDEEGTAYIVMEYIDGITLRQLLHQPRKADVGLVLDVAFQSLSALGYLHRKGFVHRDVAPDNLMLTDWETQPHVTLIDLGIAKALSEAKEAELTSAGTFLGKIRYASPEQFGSRDSKGKPDHRADLYSFGVVLYELATGRYPIVGKSSPALMAGHLYQPPLSFDETDPRGYVPQPLRDAILKALEKDPDERFASAEEFIATLSALRAPMPEPTPTPGAWSGVRPGLTVPQSTVSMDSGALPSETEEELAPTLVTGDQAAGEQAGTLPGPTVVTEPLAQDAAIEGDVRRPAKVWLAFAAAALLLVVLSALVRIEALPFTGWARPSGAAPERVPSELLGLDWGRYFALVIGNNDYRNVGLQDLKTPAGDAAALADVLEQRYGFAVERLIDGERRQIIQTLERYIDALGPDDNLLVFYAGHGHLDPYSGKGSWQPVDAEVANPANWIPTDDVAELLLDIPARRVLLISDSCFAGALMDDWSVQPPQIALDDPEAVRERLARRTRLVMAAGNVSPVADTGGGDHSIFSRALLDALAENGGILESGALFAGLEPTVARISERQGTPQEPRFAALRTDEEGGFFFVPRR